MFQLALLCKEGKGISIIDPEFVISENNNLELVEGQVWTTGRWSISDKTLHKLLGKNLIIVPSRTDKSYIGGEICGYYPAGDGRYQIAFVVDENLKNISVPNWNSQNPVFLQLS